VHVPLLSRQLNLKKKKRKEKRKEKRGGKKKRKYFIKANTFSQGIKFCNISCSTESPCEF
jgi:hypothetical protein